MTGTTANFDASLTTDATGTNASRDLILGLTNDNTATFPGIVAMSKVVRPEDAVEFSQTDMFGTWRVYVQRVESKLAGSTTQVGQTTFSPSGTFTTGTLVDASTPAVTTTLTTGNLLVGANGSVTGSLSVSALATADRYSFIGTMRAAKDVITGVLTANLSARTTTHYGLVTMVRDVTLFDLGQPAYSVTEGSTLTVTVKRTGNLTAPATVSWSVGGGTSTPGDFTAPTGGTLTFAASVATQMFSVKTTVNTLVDGNRSANIVLSAPGGPGAMLGSLASAPLNIVDEDRAGTVKLSAASYPVLEAGKNALVTIQRTGTALASGVVVQFSITDGTAQAGRDYTLPANTSATFGPGVMTQTVSIPILENPLVDGPRSFTFALTGITPVSGVIGTPSSATVTIADNDVGGTVQFSTAAYAVNEPASGNTSAVITVARTLGMAGGVLVDFATADGTARAGHNYVATSGTLTFDSTNTSKTFSIPIIGEAAVEGDNTVLLSLSNVRSSTGFGGAGVPVLGTLRNAILTIKDAQKGLQFGASNYSVSEATAMATINVVRTGPLSDTATVRYSTSDGTAVTGVNYVATSGILTFAPTIAAMSFPVKILPDKVVGGPKTVLLALSGANSSVAPPVTIGPRASAVLTISDADAGGTIKFASATFSVNEAAGSAVITVTRTGGMAGAVTVDYATADLPCPISPCPGIAESSEDYEPRAGTLTFGPGETMKTFPVPIVPDSVFEGNETFLVNLSNVQGGATLGSPSQAVVTIVDDDQGGAVQLSAAAYTVNEPTSGNASARITVTRTGTADAASVLFLTGAGTAIPSVNYVPVASTLVFDAGVMSKDVLITVIGDNNATGNLTVPITLTSPANGATLGALRSAVLTIIDANRSVRFSAPAYTVNEGSVATITVVRGGSTTGAVTVHYSTGNDSAMSVIDYVAKAGTLTFGAGITSQTFTVTTLKRADANGDRTLNLTLDTPNPGSVGIPLASATLTIKDIDNAGTFQFSPATYSVVEGTPVTLTVTRSGGSVGSVNVPWTLSGPGAAGITPSSGNVSFLAAATSKTLVLTPPGNTILDGNRSATVTLGTPIVLSGGGVATLGASAAATVNVLDNDSGGVIQMAAAAKTVPENVAPATVNLGVTRTGTNLASGVLVDYTVTGDTSAVSSPLAGTLTFGVNQAAATIALTVVNSGGADLDRNVLVALSNPRTNDAYVGANSPTLGALGNTSVTITDTLPRVQFASANFTVVEGDAAVITVTKTGPLASSPTVAYATADGTAVAGTDYTATAGTLTVTGASKTFSIPTANDDVLGGGSKTVLLGLGSSTGASIGAPGTATLTILDRQSAGTVQFANATASVVEGGTVRVTVTRTGANLVDGVGVTWSATGGNATSPDDFAPASGSLTFEAGVTSQSFEITAVDDGLFEGTETIVLSLDPPTGGAALGAPSAMTIFIIDRQQTVGFASATASIRENASPATVQIVRSGIPSGVISVLASTVDGTAVAGQDYTATSSAVTFQAGEIAKAFTVPILTQNASARSGNRVFSVVLSDPVNAAVNSANVSTVTILDSRPDLIIASVSAPSGALTGKAVSTPSTVRNIGPVPVTTPFSIGIYMVRAQDFDAANPRAGSLVASQDVASLAAGASAAFPTQVTIDDGFPAGDYYLSAVANFDERIAEADTGNNGRSAFPVAISVKKNLTKFKSASAAFSQTSPPAPPSSQASPPARSSAPLAPLDAGTCDAQGSVNLTGTFALSNQLGNSAQGQANLTGTLNDEPVQYILQFTGTGDDNNNVTAVLDSVIFRSLTTPQTGSGNGSLVGTLDGRTLRATVSGQFTTSTGGACVFTGTLDAIAQTSFQLRQGTGTDASSFGFGTTPSEPIFPVGPQGRGAEFQVFFDSDFPDPSSVIFTGPTGSGITNQPAKPDESHIDEGFEARYRVGTEKSGTVPGGKWTVLYKGQPRTFTLPPFNANASYVVVFPTVTLDTAGKLTRVDWVYRNRLNGSVFTSIPPFIAAISVRVDVNGANGDQPESGFLSPSKQFFDSVIDGFTSPEWAKVQNIRFQYVDLAGNLYEQGYDKAFSVQVQPRLENTYGGSNSDGFTFYPPDGSHERLLQVFVDVPSGSVSTQPCPPGQFNGPTPQSGPPFIVQIQNKAIGTGLPFDSPTCVDKTGTTIFQNGSTLTDIFSLRANLDTDFGSPLPPLPVGAQFQLDITTLNDGPQTVVTTIENPEATEFISIPNPATPTLKPSGGKLADAKLGINQTISWTKPSFPIRDVFVSANVNTANFNSFCSSPQPNVTVDSTQATYKFLTSCFGQPVTSAQVCVFYHGVSGEESTACWFFFDPFTGN